MSHASDPPRSGSCLCGRVRFAIAGPLLEASHCHCSRCRKQHGAAFATYGAFDRSGVQIEGAESLTRYPSTDEVTRSFCATCGSSLFWEHAALRRVLWIALATLDAPADLVVDSHIWVGSRAPWCTIGDDLPRHVEGFPIADVLALMDARRRGAEG